ncbi:hypothetical protein P9112_010848 [Eukaryota sp. TZLM1-RC]
MKLLLLTITLFALVFAGCRCPSPCNFGYSGTNAQCFCWCQQTANAIGASSDARCTYFPSGQFSSGGCSLCASNINSLSLTDEESVTENKLEESKADAVVALEDNNTRIFPLRRCKCPSQCSWGYSGTYQQCTSWARSIASLFLNGQYTVTYFPRAQFSSGGCSACGNTDPCKAF